MIETFPLFLKTDDCAVLVVGYGPQTAAKVKLLQSYRWPITWVSPSMPNESIVDDDEAVRCLASSFDLSMLEGVSLVFIGDMSEQESADIANPVKQRGVAVNVVDRPDLSTFTVPAIVQRGALQLAISTGGAMPVLGRRLRQKLDHELPQGLGPLLDAADQLKDWIREQLPDLEDRTHFWDWLLDRQILESLQNGGDSCEQLLADAVTQYKSKHQKGVVYLVGAGPGDPELLTMKAVRLLQQADVVVYDRLVSDEIIDLSRRDAERIYVGKQEGWHALPQEQINQLLVDLAKRGLRVVRLKGGDPYIFGRGGEEAQDLQDAGVRFCVIPGVTAASGCAAYSGIPLTHRDHAQSVSFITGHLKKGELDLDWQRLAGSRQTLVFYMGLGALHIISEQLMAHGMPADMPAAVIQQGTTPHQRTLVATLATVKAECEAQKFKSPALIIIGTTVALAHQLGEGGRPC